MSRFIVNLFHSVIGKGNEANKDIELTDDYKEEDTSCVWKKSASLNSESSMRVPLLTSVNHHHDLNDLKSSNHSSHDNDSFISSDDDEEIIRRISMFDSKMTRREKEGNCCCGLYSF